MRLRVLDHGHRLRQRIALTMIRVAGRTEPDPVAKVSFYRPRLFGSPWLQLTESAMRGPSEWSEAERELLGAFVSRLNDCPFCIGIHTAIAEHRLDESVTAARLDRWRDGEFGPRLTAAFGLLERVTSDPQHVGRDDVERARAGGLSDAALSDALFVGFIFNTINRLANAFDFGWETEADRIKLARSLDRIAYHVPSFLLR
jgi:uncharacterized peroxidase-related enzyme